MFFGFLRGFMQKNAIVITGFLGYIGFNLTVTLLRLGYNVVGVDRKAENGEVKRFFDDTEFKCVGKFTPFKADLTNKDEVDDFIHWCKTKKITAYAIVHLCAETKIPESFKNPINTVGNNVLCTHHALQISSALKAVRFVHASSITELDTQHWNPYSFSKTLSTEIIHRKSLFDLTSYEYVIISNPLGSLVGVDRSGGAFETALCQSMFEGKTLQLSVEKNGIYDEVYKRNFITMFELIACFMRAITEPKTSTHMPYQNKFIQGFVLNKQDKVQEYSITQFANYCNKNNDMSIEYVEPVNFTRTKVILAEPQCNGSYEMNCATLRDVPDLIFDPPAYFNDEQKAMLKELHNLFKAHRKDLFCQNVRFELLYKTLVLSRVKKCFIS